MPKQGRHRMPDKYTKGRDTELGVRFEAKVRSRLKKRKSEKAGRKANRRK